jgi:hypothetical protein
MQRNAFREMPIDCGETYDLLVDLTTPSGTRLKGRKELEVVTDSLYVVRCTLELVN